jgi:hypothetical protein
MKVSQNKKYLLGTGVKSFIKQVPEGRSALFPALIERLFDDDCPILMNSKFDLIGFVLKLGSKCQKSGKKLGGVANLVLQFYQILKDFLSTNLKPSSLLKPV